MVRNRKFFEGISKDILDIKKENKEIIVVDAGSGTGILGAFSLYLGANKCYFLEDNPYSLELSKKLIGYLGFMEKSIFIECDATNYSLPEKYDICISETLSSGFVDEDFPFIINNLKQFGKNDSIIIPSQFEIVITEISPPDKGELEGVNYKHHFLFKAKNGFKKKRIKLKNKNSQKISFKTKAYIYEDIFIESGDCMSFLNERVLDVRKDKHPLFEFINI